MALSREAILKHAGNVETKEIHVPKWVDENGDDTVILRAMTIKEFEIHQARLERAGEEKGEATARLLARVIVDGNGARVFTDDDVSQISNLGLAEVMKLSTALNELSGLGEDDEKQAEINTAVAGESAAQSSSS